MLKNCYPENKTNEVKTLKQMDLNQDIDTLQAADDQDMLSEDFEDENDEEI